MLHHIPQHVTIIIHGDYWVLALGASSSIQKNTTEQGGSKN
jgi:hypothetical protein